MDGSLRWKTTLRPFRFQVEWLFINSLQEWNGKKANEFLLLMVIDGLSGVIEILS